MSLSNITIDDWDSSIVYLNPGDWSTPNPQDNPSWFNASSQVTGSIWNEATYHQTSVNGTQALFNFTGSSLHIYGASGPAYGDYSIGIDSVYAYNNSAHAAQNGTDRFLMYSTDQLVYGPHEITITNLGSGILLDMVVIGVELGAQGATLTNTTLDESDPSITYTGSWTTNNDTLFHGGSSIYTSTPNDSLSFQFAGSAVYIYGDQVDDHGYYSIFFNDSATPVATLTGRSGCGGRTDKYCEKLQGLEFFANDLPEGRHTLKLVNGGTSDHNTFFDLDYMVYTTPSTYSTRTLVTNSSCPFTNCTSASAGGGAASGSSTAPPSATSTSSKSSAMASTILGAGLSLGITALTTTLLAWVTI